MLRLHFYTYNMAAWFYATTSLHLV